MLWGKILFENIKINISRRKEVSVQFFWPSLPCDTPINSIFASDGGTLLICYTHSAQSEWTKHLKGFMISLFSPPPLQLSLPNANSPPQAGKFGNRTPDAAFIPKSSHVCWVSERAMLCHSTHLSRENWNHSVSNTLNDFPTSHLPHLLLSAQFDLF